MTYLELPKNKVKTGKDKKEIKQEKKRNFQPEQENKKNNKYLEKIYEPNLRNLLTGCYQCGCCSGICQLSKVQQFAPSKFIYQILVGYEEKVLKSGILWQCLTCNSCLQNCPEDINFAEIIRNARYKMRKVYNQNPSIYIAHDGIYLTISEIMSKPFIYPERSLEWIPKGVKVSDKGKYLYYVGCLPFFKFEFNSLDSIAASSLNIIYKIEKEPIVVLKEETCCGHDLYWGQGKFKTFIKLAKKNKELFEKTGVSVIITACAECYRTLKIDYPKLFDNFNDRFEVKHIIEYIYDNWKKNKIEFIKPDENNEQVDFTYHDPCRLSRFLPKENNILNQIREIFDHLKSIGYYFEDMEYNKENSLCCGVSCWMNCNEGSKALTYNRLLQAKSIGNMLVTSCPKCIIHFSCTQNDYEDISSIKILDVSEFLVDLIKIIN